MNKHFCLHLITQQHTPTYETHTRPDTLTLIHQFAHSHSLFLELLRAARLVVLPDWLLSSMLGSKAGLTRPGSSDSRATVELGLSLGSVAMVSSDVLSVHSPSCERLFLSAESP